MVSPIGLKALVSIIEALKSAGENIAFECSNCKFQGVHLYRRANSVVVKNIKK